MATPSRKRQKLSDESLPLATKSKASTSITSNDEMPALQTSQEALTGLSRDLEAVQQLLLCRICSRLMHLPFTTSCGHSACYSCLAQWFQQKMTCPDCRCAIKQQPVCGRILPISETPDVVVRQKLTCTLLHVGTQLYYPGNGSCVRQPSRTVA